MAVNIERRHFPIVREVRAVKRLAGGGDRVISVAAIKVICTALIACLLIGIVGVAVYQGKDVPAGLGVALGGVITYYFVQPTRDDAGGGGSGK